MSEERSSHQQNFRPTQSVRCNYKQNLVVHICSPRETAEDTDDSLRRRPGEDFFQHQKRLADRISDATYTDAPKDASTTTQSAPEPNYLSTQATKSEPALVWFISDYAAEWASVAEELGVGDRKRKERQQAAIASGKRGDSAARLLAQYVAQNNNATADDSPNDVQDDDDFVLITVADAEDDDDGDDFVLITKTDDSHSS